MNAKIPPNSDILSWDPENMDTYWQQCRQFDTRSLNTYKADKNNVWYPFIKKPEQSSKK